MLRDFHCSRLKRPRALSSKRPSRSVAHAALLGMHEPASRKGAAGSFLLELSDLQGVKCASFHNLSVCRPHRLSEEDRIWG